MIKSTSQFAEACRNLTHAEIYELFEDGTTDSVRDHILTFTSNSPEPVRTGLNIIGRKYKIESLIAY